MPARRMVRDVPLSPESIDGWRAWSVLEQDGELRLSSLTRAEPWAPEKPFIAICSRRRHAVPGRSCTCGIYAAAGPEGLARLGKIAGAAVGQVSMWGQVAEHRRGYRASMAYPARLRLVCVPCLGDGRGVPATHIDRDFSAPARLVPLCEMHASGRALPPAGPTQERLLSTYLVEMVPDGSVERIRTDEVEDERRRAARRRSVVALAALTIVAVAVLLRGPGRAGPEVTAATHASIGTAPRELQNGVQLPLERSTNGLTSSPRLRVLLLTPVGFGAPRCGRLTASDVVPAECLDLAADVFVQDIGPAGAHREGTCSGETVVTTRKGDRLLCWRLLPQT